jgi:hypothetical protein
VQLLARLVQNFPGANIRIVLLLGTSARSRKIFESFDRRMLRWDIEAPTPEQAEAMLAQGREDGCEGAVKTLLQKMQAPLPGEMAEADPAGIDPLGFDAPGRSQPGTDVFIFSGGTDKARAETAAWQAKADKAEARAARGRGGFLRWFLAISALAVLSVGITAWLHPDVFSLDRLQLAQRWARSTLQGATPAVAVVAAPPQLAAAAPAATASEATPAVVPEAAVSLAPPAATDVATPAPAPTAEAPNPPVKEAVKAPIKAPVGAEDIELPAEALAAQAWLKPMPFGTFVVQHAAMPTYQAALQWKSAQPALSAARVVALYRPNQKIAYFSVVSGPFASRKLATEFSKSRGVPADAWVRSARSMRDQFTPELANAGKRQETRP